ncbi:hypothetical protein [Aquimarina sp. MMG016]|uniref:hypothetical protein n=1 Tax=Aquimarina sp. MMG016 TaxID=2822690 RepID=UPI001B39E562|nr:hypothetical protein [Aquimarina sp. MMG016]MBQ4819929.1 hypothetical protein [Aquimarina sp. MMG016]
MTNYYKETNTPDASGHITFLYGFDKNNDYICLGGNQGSKLKFSRYKREGANYTFTKIIKKKKYIMEQRFNCFLVPIDYKIGSYDENIPVVSINEINRKHGINVKKASSNESTH